MKVEVEVTFRCTAEVELNKPLVDRHGVETADISYLSPSDYKKCVEMAAINIVDYDHTGVIKKIRRLS
jgi:hypothetical protein